MVVSPSIQSFGSKMWADWVETGTEGCDKLGWVSCWWWCKRCRGCCSSDARYFIVRFPFLKFLFHFKSSNFVEKVVFLFLKLWFLGNSLLSSKVVANSLIVFVRLLKVLDSIKKFFFSKWSFFSIFIVFRYLGAIIDSDIFIAVRVLDDTSVHVCARVCMYVMKEVL